jgi:L-threonine kinase
MPGTCGELVQGTLDGVPCLVSCPMDLFAEVSVVARPGTGLVLAPPSMSKTHRAVSLAMESLGCTGADVHIHRHHALPEGKGYASSSADILAALFALSRLLGSPLSPEEATRLALAVEPTDSIAWEGLALLAHRDGQLMQPLGPPPELAVLVLDWGGFVDTLAFNSADYTGTLARLAPLHKEAFAMLQAGIASADPVLVGQAATQSALAHQAILYKPQLESVLQLAKRAGALGVCVAHSGTLIGVLLHPEGAQEALPYLLSRLPGRPAHRLCRVIGGGPRWPQEVP